MREVSRRTTRELIARLADDPPRRPRLPWAWRLGIVWAAAALGMASLMWSLARLFPDMAYLPPSLLQPIFLLRGGLWLLAFAASARLSYLLTLPWRPIRNARRLSAITLATLTLGLVTALPWRTLGSAFAVELVGMRGPCGALIALTTLATGAMILVTSRRGVVNEAGPAGFWTMAAAGSLSSFFMQLICRHEEAAHVLLWHVLPVAAACLLGIVIARPVLAETRKRM